MAEQTDLVILGAGPAGMAAAIVARQAGLDVILLDEQPTPGGQIWRAIETRAAAARDDILGAAYLEGRPLAEAFRASGADYRAGTQVWQIDPGFRVFATRGETSTAIRARAVLLASGAQERPVPFPGWTLPGVLTVGAAQILLKAAMEIPAGPVWVAGSGPLPLLYLTQLLRAGGRIAGYLDTTPAGRWRAALPHLPGALAGAGDILKGLGWLAALRRAGVRIVPHVTDLAALGTDHVTAIRYRSANGPPVTTEAETLLVHEGVVPNLHVALSLGCETVWSDAQDCFHPVLDPWGQSSVEGLFIAGDGAGIGGATAARLRGELAAWGVALRLGATDTAAAEQAARPIRRQLRRELGVRPFLDAMFRPREQAFRPADETVVCRCEEVTAGDVRRLAATGRLGPNQIKTATRAGMGPCQGRQCSYAINRIIADAQKRAPSEVGLPHVRPPLKPVTLGQLASLDQEKPSP